MRFKSNILRIFNILLISLGRYFYSLVLLRYMRDFSGLRRRIIVLIWYLHNQRLGSLFGWLWNWLFLIIIRVVQVHFVIFVIIFKIIHLVIILIFIVILECSTFTFDIIARVFIIFWVLIIFLWSFCLISTRRSLHHFINFCIQF